MGSSPHATCRRPNSFPHLINKHLCSLAKGPYYLTWLGSPLDALHAMSEEPGYVLTSPKASIWFRSFEDKNICTSHLTTVMVIPLKPMNHWNLSAPLLPSSFLFFHQQLCRSKKGAEGFFILHLAGALMQSDLSRGSSWNNVGGVTRLGQGQLSSGWGCSRLLVTPRPDEWVQPYSTNRSAKMWFYQKNT